MERGGGGCGQSAGCGGLGGDCWCVGVMPVVVGGVWI